jgi:ribose transport system ATP-binding protein
VIFGGEVVDELPAATADEPTLLRAAYGLPPGVAIPEEIIAAQEGSSEDTISTPGGTV